MGALKSLLDPALGALKASWVDSATGAPPQTGATHKRFIGADSRLRVHITGLPGGGGGGGAPDPHKATHQNGGTDEINVAGLSGVLADPQPPIIGAGAAQAVAGNDPRLTDARPPSGPAGGVLSGTYPNPGFAADMATQAELDVTNLAIVDLQTDVAAVETAVTDHLADATDAHDAAAISYAGGTGMSAVNVEAAIDELATEKADASALTAHTGNTGIHVPAGGSDGNVLTKVAGAPAWAAPGSGGGGPTKIAGSTGAFVADTTWLTLTANTANITVTAQTTVMSLTGIGAGRYRIKCVLVYQAAATTTGIGITLNHTGTVTRCTYNWMYVTTGGAAATGIADQATAVAAGQLMEAKAERVKDTRSSFTVGVDTANADQLAVLDAILVVTASGTLELKIATEVAGSAVRLMEGSTIEISKLT